QSDHAPQTGETDTTQAPKPQRGPRFLRPSCAEAKRKDDDDDDDDGDGDGDGDGAQDWCAVYINLARRPDRRERLLGQLGAWNGALARRLQRVDAVDGQRLDLGDELVARVVDEQAAKGPGRTARGPRRATSRPRRSARGPRKALERAEHARRRGAYTIVHRGGHLMHFDNHLTPGGIACAMSHRRALEAVASHPTAR
ncbi:unnamed protein product, partial [Prorocentrum cordatum]